ncbi:MAG: hypothetical protein HXS41_11470 [Theionarchaea archaeon]|nr:hypothetical protein [Theionarchaea archaeon]MBU7000035.1 hypothetical protein [Theionarchaea archaeon]MBU7021667.1 hypothetical protein [Theionarchaea archaeon]MBU7034686.1 hypothetical protein [Theionarchaea archaeon]MBU7039346.1 hypothetical protein [Theionarchaea archaeon]
MISLVIEDKKSVLQHIVFILLAAFILSSFTIFLMLERITTFPSFNMSFLFGSGLILGYLTVLIVKDIRKSFLVCLAIVLVTFVLTALLYSIPSFMGINPALEPVLFSALGWSMVYSILLLMVLFLGLVIGFILHSSK